MKKINYTVVAEAGIHARPAGLLVKQAASFKSDIKILNEENGNEDEAYTVLESFLKENF